MIKRIQRINKNNKKMIARRMKGKKESKMLKKMLINKIYLKMVLLKSKIDNKTSMQKTVKILLMMMETNHQIMIKNSKKMAKN